MIQEPSAVEEQVDFETPGNKSNKREATGNELASDNRVLDLLDLAEGSEVINQVIQNADHK